VLFEVLLQDEIAKPLLQELLLELNLINGLQSLLQVLDLLYVSAFHVQLFEGEFGHLLYLRADYFLALLQGRILEHVLNI